MSDPPRLDLRRSWREVEFASLDFETTGLDVRDHIISFAVVPIREGRIVLGERTYQEVSPASPPSPRSVTIHGLRAADLADAPDLGQVRESLRQALAGRVVIAWAAEVEAAFLARSLGRSDRWWRRRIVDVLGMNRTFERREGAPSGSDALTAAAERIGVPVHSPHDALDDALTTAEIFLVLAQRLSGRGGRSARWLRRAGRNGRR